MILQVLKETHLVLWHDVKASYLVLAIFVVMHDEHTVLNQLGHHSPLKILVDPLNGLDLICNVQMLFRVFEDQIILTFEDLTVGFFVKRL